MLFLGLQKRTAHGGGQPNQLALVDMECSVSEVSDPELTGHVCGGGRALLELSPLPPLQPLHNMQLSH